MGQYKIIESEPENPFASLVQNQTIVEIPEFELESGEVLTKIPLAYKTWGQLNEAKNNVLVICHALTGSSDVSDWWGPLLGPGKAFDPTKFFIICLNSLGSPYGSASPVTIDPNTGERYGPEFPLCTVRDDVNIHKLVLDDLGVKQIACVIGGSMGGTLVLEWAIFGIDYVRNIIPLATSARHSAWCISWSEAQRQCIYSDPKYQDGYYDPKDPPSSGLGAARMTALLTYRSRNSFESRFGRKDPSIVQNKNSSKPQLIRESSTPREENWAIHNEGHKGRKLHNNHNESPRPRSDSQSSTNSNTSTTSSIRNKHQTFFTAQSYLRYQGEKFISRFDANCYISITRKMDTHDLSRNREGDLEDILKNLKQPALVIGISSDGLFTYTEQETIAKFMPNAKLERINSPEGHDAFLLEFAAIDKLIIDFLAENCKEIVQAPGIEWNEAIEDVKDSVFGEAEDVTNW
ncbi:Homoserine O-acetyltransferase [Wickerhamomyces ciferrii]|uniref:Homoserine O-acetyltransferase n=1 Tax=Wickerhamomyces ciferrii (strain ATCC 14091 / BCRC 22168 / CBS 111 / JCM 3599 / NBRC 0793 / NRRL Y-1031 F-60-10) TaxID=1206466 RepID=K0KXN3_WICCF|nr:Homoserine O-acetyltransferase [Wickerhamomyces ciferrii]CCH45813.1 Homoserine O-acetyltransferase [Wickerhamomyces ciferrii]